MRDEVEAAVLTPPLLCIVLLPGAISQSIVLSKRHTVCRVEVPFVPLSKSHSQPVSCLLFSGRCAHGLSLHI